MNRENQEKSILGNFMKTDINIGSSERVLSMVGGGALAAYGIKRGGILGTLLAVLGSDLVYRGATGHCMIYDSLGINTSTKSEDPNSPYNKGWLAGRVHVTKSIIINKSPAELYHFWRNFENLPKFMNHLESVQNLGGNLSRWKAKAPLGTSVEWDAELSSDRENERIGWHSIEGSDIPNSGVVEFLPTVDRGTEVRVILTYEPPAGEVGALFAKLFGEEPGQQVSEDLRRFKRLMETGEVIKTEGQTSGRAARKANA